jgi:carbon storage regulator
MLLLTRKNQEKIMIGDDIVIMICNINSSQVRLGITAPKNVTVLRSELIDKQPQQIESEKKPVIKTKRKRISDKALKELKVHGNA